MVVNGSATKIHSTRKNGGWQEGLGGGEVRFESLMLVHKNVYNYTY